MANPPYSAHWQNKEREDDPRWREYGIAPKTKADYAKRSQSVFANLNI